MMRFVGLSGPVTVGGVRKIDVNSVGNSDFFLSKFFCRVIMGHIRFCPDREKVNNVATWGLAAGYAPTRLRVRLMTSALRILLCVALLALPLAPRASGEIDEVDRLFQGDAPPSDSEPLLASEIAVTEQALPGGIPAVSSPEATSYSESALWNQPADLQTATSGAGPVADASPAKPIPPAPVSPVPEPSAIILALAALAYFLLFGRRRRVI